MTKKDITCGGSHKGAKFAHITKVHPCCFNRSRTLFSYSAIKQGSPLCFQRGNKGIWADSNDSSLSAPEWHP